MAGSLPHEIPIVSPGTIRDFPDAVTSPDTEGKHRGERASEDAEALVFSIRIHMSNEIKQTLVVYGI